MVDWHDRLQRDGYVNSHRNDSTLPYKYQWETKRLRFFCL